ncbi:hypothetical protein Q7P35_008900 [Cladosporium inversicolor]
MAPHLDLSHRGSWNTSIPTLCASEGRSTHHLWQTATPNLSAINHDPITLQTLTLPIATTKCDDVTSAESVSSTSIRTTTIATTVTTRLDAATPTVSSATNGDDHANPDLRHHFHKHKLLRHSRVGLWLRSGWDGSTSSRRPLRQTMRTRQLPQCDVDVARHRNTLLHRGDRGLRGADEQMHARAFEDYRPDPSAAGYRQNSRPISELSLRDENIEDQSSTLEAIEITDEIGELTGHALIISEVRHPVVVSSADDYTPGLSCSRFSSSSSEVDGVVDAPWRRATMPSRLYGQSNSAPWWDVRHSAV